MSLSQIFQNKFSFSLKMNKIGQIFVAFKKYRNFVVELFGTMEKHSRLKKFAHFYIVTHCYTLLLQKSIIQ